MESCIDKEMDEVELLVENLESVSPEPSILSSYQLVRTESEPGESCGRIEVMQSDPCFPQARSKRIYSWPGVGVSNFCPHMHHSVQAVPGPHRLDAAEHRLGALLNRVDTWDFDVFELAELTNGQPLAYLSYVLLDRQGLLERCHLDVFKLRCFLRLTEQAYRSCNPFHNSVHACDVLHAMHYIIVSTPLLALLSPHEVLTMLLSAIVHDIDHPGVSNAFLAGTENLLIRLHGHESILEQHHSGTAANLVQMPGCDFLTPIPVTERAAILSTMKQLVLATDMGKHKDFMPRFEETLKHPGFDLSNDKHRLLFMQLAIKCADINNSARPARLSRKWSALVMAEFFDQGDAERSLNMPVSMFMDRETTSIPKCQIGFIEFVVQPLFAVLDRVLQTPASRDLLSHLIANLDFWRQQSDLENTS